MGLVMRKVEQVNSISQGRQRAIALLKLQFKSNPVVVTKNLEIIEGKHRLIMAKELAIPISYVIVEDNNEQ